MNQSVVIREATLNDVAEIVRQRRAMYLDMDYPDSPALSAMASTCEPYLLEALPQGSFRGWLAMSDGRIAGGGAVVISPWPSHPYDLECRRATILNVYVYPEFRRQGIARRLMQTMIGWCRQQKFATVFLHASRDGRHLYESLGFEATNEMKLKLRS
jgi:GNAT superfamily N-acetyltransferase